MINVPIIKYLVPSNHNQYLNFLDPDAKTYAYYYFKSKKCQIAIGLDTKVFLREAIINIQGVFKRNQLRHDISFLFIIIIKFKEFHFNSKNTAISLFFIAQGAVKARIIENGLDQLNKVQFTTINLYSSIFNNPCFYTSLSSEQ